MKPKLPERANEQDEAYHNALQSALEEIRRVKAGHDVQVNGIRLVEGHDGRTRVVKALATARLIIQTEAPMGPDLTESTPIED